MDLPIHVSGGEKSPPHNSSPLRGLSVMRNFASARVVLLLLAGALPVILPFIHFGVVSHLWDEYNYNVDRKKCSCPCWDTVFKGPYERGPGMYKHVYFNATANSFKIWAVTVLAVLLVYEATKTLATLLWQGQARLSMAALLVLSVYPHYYSWWSYFNYWNDEFYSQWNHQLFFSITELASTLLVVQLLDRRVTLSSGRAVAVIAVAVLHILSSGVDQFVENVVRGNGLLHQVLRDVFFMLPDVCHVILPLLELRRAAAQRRLPSLFHAVTTQHFIAAGAFVAGGWIVCRII